MTKEQILLKLEGKYEIVREEPKPTGVQLRLNNGTIINCYNNGNHNLQGKNTQEIQNLLEGNIFNIEKKKFLLFMDMMI